MGQGQTDSRGAQFGRLFDDGFDARLLHHGDDQLQIGAVYLFADLLLGAQDDALLQHLGDAGAPLAVTAVEDQQVVARLQPHHLGQVARLVEGRSDGEAGGEVALNMQTDHAKDLAGARDAVILDLAACQRLRHPQAKKGGARCCEFSSDVQVPSQRSLRCWLLQQEAMRSSRFLIFAAGPCQRDVILAMR
ncbi:hypothetical protein D3C72_1391930 [compost metagenome]